MELILFKWTIIGTAYFALSIIAYAVHQHFSTKKEESTEDDVEFRLQQLELKTDEQSKFWAENTLVRNQNNADFRKMEDKIANLKTSFELQKGMPRGR